MPLGAGTVDLSSEIKGERKATGVKVLLWGRKRGIAVVTIAGIPHLAPAPSGKAVRLSLGLTGLKNFAGIRAGQRG